MKNNWKEEFDKKFLCDCENPNRECYQDDECTVREMRGDLKNFIKSLLAEQKKELLLEVRTYIGDLDYEDMHTKSIDGWVDEFIKSKGIEL